MALNRKVSRQLIPLKPEETLVAHRINDNNLFTFFSSPFEFSWERAVQLLYYPYSKLVYRCRVGDDIGSIHLPLKGTLIIVTDTQVIWFSGDQYGELPYSEWYQSNFRVIYHFSTQFFGATHEEAYKLFANYFCTRNQPTLLSQAIQWEEAEAIRLSAPPAEAQRDPEVQDAAPDNVKTDMKRVSAIWAKRASTADIWKVLDGLDDVEDDMPVEETPSASVILRNSQQRSTSGSVSMTAKQAEGMDPSMREGPGPAMVDGLYADDGASLEHATTGSSKPLIHTASASVSTTNKSVKDMEGGWSGEPGATFGGEKREEDDFGGARNTDKDEDVGVRYNTTRPLSTVKMRHRSPPLIYASPPEEETAWKRFVSWVCPCLRDPEEGIKVVTEIKTMEIIEIEPAQRKEEMKMGAEQVRKPEPLVAPPMGREEKLRMPKLNADGMF